MERPAFFGHNNPETSEPPTPQSEADQLRDALEQSNDELARVKLQLWEEESRNQNLEERNAELGRQVAALQAQNTRLVMKLLGESGDSAVKTIFHPDTGAVEAVIATPHSIGAAIEAGEREALQSSTAEKRAEALHTSLRGSAMLVAQATNLDLYRREKLEWRVLGRKASTEREVVDPARQEVTVTRFRKGPVVARTRLDSAPQEVTDSTAHSTDDSKTQKWTQRRQEVKVEMDSAGAIKQLSLTRFDSELMLKETKNRAEMRDKIIATRIDIDLTTGDITVHQKDGDLAEGTDKKHIRRFLKTELYGLEDVGEPLAPKKKRTVVPNIRGAKRMKTTTHVDKKMLDAEDWPRFRSETYKYELTTLVRYYDGKLPIDGFETVPLADIIAAACQQVLTTTPQGVELI